MEIRDLVNILDEIYPLNLQQSWDNSGLQFGNLKNELKNVLISLDFSYESVQEAIKNECNLIINHHPYFFNAQKKLNFDDPFYTAIQEAIKNGITVYAMHTNLDVADGGVNDNLCKILNIKNIQNLEDKEYSFGKIGEYEKELYAKDFAIFVKKILKPNGVILFGNCNKKIKKVAVCSGAGASLLDDAIKKGADVMLTSDIKYNDGLDYSNRGLVIVDPGHFASENHIIYKLKEDIEKIFENVNNKVFAFDKTDSYRTFF
ncbi:MAG: Nif3-like dinuclear metal center hexameric protein [Peptoniphilaceae bacterium]|nr:Nif3-like dinuclear metal center hexameric protein [Peptoniphilaceae bacterium]MDD7383527.1 Nif3-like dinuclear metal center hexameric protein [Peptoniphilaceae bacterium]MDY3738700.1 Nif3-like dinuclear metal center hexameric protein [Peptoniphilaceae bacterium]